MQALVNVTFKRAPGLKRWLSRTLVREKIKPDVRSVTPTLKKKSQGQQFMSVIQETESRGSLGFTASNLIKSVSSRFSKRFHLKI